MTNQTVSNDEGIIEALLPFSLLAPPLQIPNQCRIRETMRTDGLL